MSIPELVAYNNRCKKLDEYFLKGNIKNSTFGGKNEEKQEIKKIEKQEDEK